MAEIDVKFMKRNAKKVKIGNTIKPLKSTKTAKNAKKTK